VFLPSSANAGYVLYLSGQHPSTPALCPAGRKAETEHVIVFKPPFTSLLKPRHQTHLAALCPPRGSAGSISRALRCPLPAVCPHGWGEAGRARDKVAVSG